MFYSKAVNVEKLEMELKKSLYGDVFSCINALGSTVEIVFQRSLESHEINVIDEIVENHDPSPCLEQIARTKRMEAQVFGEELYNAFVDENIMLGITYLGLTNHVRKTLREVGDALLSGSLYDAIYELTLVPDTSLDPVILSPSRLLIFRNKIEYALGLSLSTVWNAPPQWV